MTIKDLFKELIVGFAILPMLITGGVYADYVIVNGVSYNSYYEFDVGECTQIGNFVYCFDEKGNLFTSDSSNEGLVAFNQWNNGPNYIYAYGRIDGKLYGFAHNTATQYTPDSYLQGFVSNFCRSDSLVGCAEGSYSYSMEDVLNGIGTIQKVYFRIPGGGGLALPYRNTNQGIFFYDGEYYYGTQFNLSDGGNAGLTGSLGFNWLNFEQVSSYSWGNSPLTKQPNIPIPTGSGLDSYTYIEVGSGDYIDYFEQKENFTEDLCYIGTKDLVSNYEDRIQYYQGSGYTLFDLYYHLFGSNQVSINRLGKYLNVVYGNYRSWFLGQNRDSDGDVIYNMIFSGDSIVYDYGPGLTSPFRNNKAYLYFIGSTALDSNIDLYTAGQDIALYCYYKLQNYSNDGVNLNVKDDYDHKGLDNNVAVNARNNRISSRIYSGADEIVGKSWEGTPIEYFSEGSGVIDASDFFSENFNKFRTVLTPISPGDLGFGYVPGYIVLFMLALILFRFLGH